MVVFRFQTLLSDIYHSKKQKQTTTTTTKILWLVTNPSHNGKYMNLPHMNLYYKTS